MKIHLLPTSCVAAIVCVAMASLLLPVPASAFTTHKIQSSSSDASAAASAPALSGRSYTQVLNDSNSIDGVGAAASTNGEGGGGTGGGGGGGALVAVNQNNIEFSAGTLGGLAGLYLGGPVLAALLGGATNYLSRKDVDAASEAVKGVATKGIEVYNYLGTLWVDNDVSGKLSTSLANSSPDTMGTIESTWKTISDKADEFAVVDLAARALGVTGDALEKVVDAALNYAEENGVADKVKAASSDALSKAKAAAADL